MFKLLFELFTEIAKNIKEKLIIFFLFLMVLFIFIGAIFITFNDVDIKAKIFGFLVVMVLVFVEGFIWGDNI